MSNAGGAEVFLIKTSNRAVGVQNLLNKFNLTDFANKHIALKANFNSADPFPASTHLDTLRAIVHGLRKAKVREITLAERSGMGDTAEVLESMGVNALAKELNFKTIVLDKIAKEDWTKIERDNTHWLRGFYIASLFCHSDKIVQTCCLKAHRFGGHFTLSLKNSVGLVAATVPGGVYNYMWELHGSPFQRQLIAEINKYYTPDLIIMDGIKAFTTGGPERGTEVEPNLMLASKDRVAIDAVGVAILRSYTSTHNIMRGRIFELDQLDRAAELGIGVKSASEIRLTPLNDESNEATNKITDILKQER